MPRDCHQADSPGRRGTGHGRQAGGRARLRTVRHLPPRALLAGCRCGPARVTPRGSFETGLSDEDEEQDPDRWCSYTPHGQECWQIISHWVWKLRLELGHVQHQLELRQTRLVDEVASIKTTQPAPTAPAPAPSSEEEVGQTSAPVEMAQEWAKCRGRFSGKDFAPVDEGMLRCPAGKLLHVRSRVPLRNGNLRICYSARIGDCRQCQLAPQCLGRNASGEMPRQVSGIRTRLEPVRRPKVTPWQEHEEQPPLAAPGELRWGDVGGRAIRRTWFRALRTQQVKLEEHAEQTTALAPSAPTSPVVWTRAQRAHARLRWQERLDRKRKTRTDTRFRITLLGVAPHIAAYLNLASVSPEG